MKINIEPKLLADAVAMAREVVKSKSAIAALDTLLFTATESGLTITATNMEQYLSVTIPCDVVETGSICLPSKYIQAIASTVARTADEMNIAVDGPRARVTGHSSEAIIPYLMAREFPALPDVCTEHFWAGEGGTLSEDLSWCYGCMDTSRVGSIYQGVHVIGGIGMVSTDSHCGVMARGFEDEEPSASFAIPAAAIPVLAKVVSQPNAWTIGRNPDGEVTMLRVANATTTLTTRLVQLENAGVPNKLMSQFSSHSKSGDDDNVWEFDSTNLREALQSVFAFDLPGRMTLRGEGDNVSLLVNSADHNFRTTISGSSPIGEERDVSPLVFKRALGATKADTVLIRQSGDKWVVADGNRTACMMGMRRL